MKRSILNLRVTVTLTGLASVVCVLAMLFLDVRFWGPSFLLYISGLVAFIVLYVRRATLRLLRRISALEASIHLLKAASQASDSRTKVLSVAVESISDGIESLALTLTKPHQAVFDSHELSGAPEVVVRSVVETVQTESVRLPLLYWLGRDVPAEAGAEFRVKRILPGALPSVADLRSSEALVIDEGAFRVGEWKSFGESLDQVLVSELDALLSRARAGEIPVVVFAQQGTPEHLMDSRRRGRICNEWADARKGVLRAD